MVWDLASPPEELSFEGFGVERFLFIFTGGDLTWCHKPHIEIRMSDSWVPQEYQ